MQNRMQHTVAFLSSLQAALELRPHWKVRPSGGLRCARRKAQSIGAAPARRIGIKYHGWIDAVKAVSALKGNCEGSCSKKGLFQNRTDLFVDTEKRSSIVLVRFSNRNELRIGSKAELGPIQIGPKSNLAQMRLGPDQIGSK